jgi:outer membrane protein assembly factor BamB
MGRVVNLDRKRLVWAAFALLFMQFTDRHQALAENRTLTDVRVSASDAPPAGGNAHVSKRVPAAESFGLAAAAPLWSTKFDGDVRFYQQTELGALIVGTDKSLYAVDAETGATLWRRKDVKLDETEVAPVPGTDVLLLSLEQGDKARLEALDQLTGQTLWRSDKVRGQIMQMAGDVDSSLLAVVTVRDARGRARGELRRKPVVYALDLQDGRQRWKYELGGDVRLMPLRWGDDDDFKTAFTLDNYHPPFFLDGQLYLLYEGVTTLDAARGKRQDREKFNVNEEGLALTEAAPVADERHVYVSGRGKVRAFSRASGEVVWEAKDLGLTPELMLAGRTLYARTGGQFTRLEDGELKERGPFGVSALDAATGKTLWRFKGADKGLTNFVLANEGAILAADRDDLLWLSTADGKRQRKVSHRIERAAFVVLNAEGAAVVGGQKEIAAFDVNTGRELWRARHDAPGRGFFRTLAAIAARAGSLYFRFGGLATTAFRGVQLARAVGSFSWSGLSWRAAQRSATSLLVSQAREQARQRFRPFGLAARLNSLPARPGLSDVRGRVAGRARNEAEDQFFDRLDPARQLDKLARYLWRRERLATLRGEWMYFYTDIPQAGNGLAGVNLNTGQTLRHIPLTDLDARFLTDETAGALFYANGNRLTATALE